MQMSMSKRHDAGDEGRDHNQPMSIQTLVDCMQTR